MRNCFVPYCDIICKNQPRRKMFMAPKDPESFEIWKSVLPKKRELKKFDRICERHFKQEDIQTTWEHIINGIVHIIQRDKPKLISTAIPLLNLPDDSIVRSKNEQTSKRKKVSKDIDAGNKIVKKQHTDTEDSEWNEFYLDEDDQEEINESDNTNNVSRLVVDVLDELDGISNEDEDENFEEMAEDEKYLKPQRAESSSSLSSIAEVVEDDDKMVEDKKKLKPQRAGSSSSSIAELPESETQHDAKKSDIKNDKSDTNNLANKDVHQPIIVEHDERKITAFDLMYDDVFEIELPNTLWGLHRDPDRNFIVFSQYDPNAVNIIKYLHVDNSFVAKSFIYGKCFEAKILEEINIDVLSKLINELDDIKICAKSKELKIELIDCNLIAKIDEDKCSKCLKKGESIV